MIQQNTIYASLGDLIAALYEQYFACYQDSSLANLAVTTTLNELFEDNSVAAYRIFGEAL